MMGTIIGILFLVDLFVVGAAAIKNGAEFANDGSGCGCIFGVLMILFGLGLIRTGLGAPIGMILIALIVIVMAVSKK